MANKTRKNSTFSILFTVTVILAFVLILSIPFTRQIFIILSTNHPYFMGFIKFGLLASVGEILAIRITSGVWGIPKGAIWKAIVWGCLGIVITLVFQIFGAGVKSAMSNGYLPGGDSQIAFAFLVSVTMNMTFAPTMMAFHRIVDTWIDMKCDKTKDITIAKVVSTIDWSSFVSFVVIKTIPIFWIPAHTVTFLLPSEYRVMAAASLSMALGAILAFARRKSRLEGQ